MNKMELKRTYPKLAFAISLMIVACMTVWFGSSYHGPQPPDVVDVSGNEFSAIQAIAQFEKVLGEEVPHAAGTAQNEVVRDRLVEALKSIGLQPQLFPFEVDGIEMCNVQATVPGDGSRRPVVVATHYDSVEEGPGAGDAGACVAALLEVARILNEEELQPASARSDIVFLFTDGEEWVRGIGHGLNGATHFVSESDLIERDPLIVNFDARGAAGPSLMYETSRNNFALMQAVLPVLPRPAFTASSYVAVYDLLPNATDFTIFKRKGLEGLNFAFIDDPHRYHTAEDTVENLDARCVQHHGENALSVVRLLAHHPTQNWDSDENAVFFLVLSRFEIIYPERLAVSLAAVVLLLQLIGLVFSVRRGRLDTRSFGLAVGVLLLLPGVMIGVGYFVHQLDSSRPQSSHGFGSLDPWLVGGLWLLTLAICTFTLWCFRKLTCESVWHGVWFLAAVFGLLMSVFLPGFSYLFLATAFAPSVMGLLPFRKSTLSIFVVALSAIVLVPIGWQFGIALGLRMVTVLSVLYTLLLAPLMPLLVREKT